MNARLDIDHNGARVTREKALMEARLAINVMASFAEDFCSQIRRLRADAASIIDDALGQLALEEDEFDGGGSQDAPCCTWRFGHDGYEASCSGATRTMLSPDCPDCLRPTEAM